MNHASVELVMSEFGPSRRNAGGAVMSNDDRLNPTLDSFLRVFPDAIVTLYTDNDRAGLNDSRVKIEKVIPPFDSSDVRYGWRAHDYYQAVGLLNSKADIAIAMDSDMLIVSSGFSVISEFAGRFGMALPINPRLLLKIDGGIGVDSTYVANDDSTLGLGLTYNLTPIAFFTRSTIARKMLDRYCELMLASPGRGAVHIVRASFELGYQPFVLPPQWCVCSPRDLESPHIWEEAIALHVGHRDVLPRWLSNRRRRSIRESLRKRWMRLMSGSGA